MSLNCSDTRGMVSTRVGCDLFDLFLDINNLNFAASRRTVSMFDYNVASKHVITIIKC